MIVKSSPISSRMKILRNLVMKLPEVRRPAIY
jgi:hypothetical protein